MRLALLPHLAPHSLTIHHAPASIVFSLAFARCTDQATWKWRLPSYQESVITSAINAGQDVPGTPVQLRPMMILDFASTFGVGSGGITALSQLRDAEATPDVDVDAAGAAAATDAPERAWRRQVLQHSPPYSGSTVCVGFGDGAVLVFREATRSFSARTLASPDAFRCLGVLVNPDAEWTQRTNRAVTSLSVSRCPAPVSTNGTASGSGESDLPIRVLVTYAGYPRIVEFTLPPGATPWEREAVADPNALPRVGCVNFLSTTAAHFLSNKK